MRWLSVVILWVLSSVLYLAILNGFRWLGIEREVFDIIGRLTIAVGCTFVLYYTVIHK